LVTPNKTVGVLALQGDVREHLNMLASVGVATKKVRNPNDLVGVDGLIIPGGESTTISMLAQRAGLVQPIRDFIKSGKAVYGSCAGMIMLADRILDGRTDQEVFGGIDITVKRNAFGRQVDSFEGLLNIESLAIENFNAVFIRAPWVEKVAADVEVLAKVVGESGEERVVMVRQGKLLATSFHPELTGDNRIHKFFVSLL
jgi:pyridoxal 5'-phosphate synthase pdxT subunit